MSSVPSEKQLYLEHLRRRCVMFVDLGGAGPRIELGAVLRELRNNQTRVLLFDALSTPTADLPELSTIEGGPGAPGASRVYRELRRSGSVRCRRPRAALLNDALASATALGLRKVVLLLPDWPANMPSFLATTEVMDNGRLPDLPEYASWSEIAGFSQAGVDAVNLCCPAQLHDELFTYQGAGTLVSPRAHASVRALGVDELDRAYDLIARGAREGYLAPRSEPELDELVSSLLGVFVAGQLCGVASLRPFGEGHALELGTLYTISRFKGGGMGSRLVQDAIEMAASRGGRELFACTISPAVAGFFRQHGFSACSHAQLPEEKWRDYDAERRAKLITLRRPL